MTRCGWVRPGATWCGARVAAVLLSAAMLVASACVDRLPDQDRRILQATPVAKLSTDILWKEYQADRRAADRRYWGKPVEVSGKISTIIQDPPVRLMFLPERDSTVGIDARLLDDGAQTTLKDAAAGSRVTLRCFCEGLNKNVILKSCIRP